MSRDTRSNYPGADILDQVRISGEFYNRVTINELGRIEIIDDEVLSYLKYNKAERVDV